MKKLLTCLIACGAPLLAQSLAGTWQGTYSLHRVGGLRIVLKVATGPGDGIDYEELAGAAGRLSPSQN